MSFDPLSKLVTRRSRRAYLSALTAAQAGRLEHEPAEVVFAFSDGFRLSRRVYEGASAVPVIPRDPALRAALAAGCEYYRASAREGQADVANRYVAGALSVAFSRGFHAGGAA